MTFNNIKDFYSSPDNLQLNKNELKKINKEYNKMNLKNFKLKQK